jgi:hypothetical protein
MKATVKMINICPKQGEADQDENEGKIRERYKDTQNNHQQKVGRKGHWLQ